MRSISLGKYPPWKKSFQTGVVLVMNILLRPDVVLSEELVIGCSFWVCLKRLLML